MSNRELYKEKSGFYLERWEAIKIKLLIEAAF